MAFTSLAFLGFVAATIIVYYLFPIKLRWVVLLVASYAFYLLSSANTLVFLVLTTVVTYAGGRYIGNVNSKCRARLAELADEITRDQKKEIKNDAKKSKRRMVALILIVDFGVLAALKYFRVYIEALAIPGLTFDLGDVLIPLGISFYTFQSAAYIIDLYRDKIEADRNIAKFALFTSFFPQIVQGPIARHSQLADQLYTGHEFEYVNLAHGAQLILWGFFKKLVIADRAGILVNQVFNNYGDYSGWAIAIALVFYSIQIYGDFSGGIDIARGAARCLGIDMAHNFRRPYFSDSLSEFWRRWHMSLSSWCRDYIFFPISLSKTFGKMGRSLRSVLGDRVGKLFPIIVAQLATFVTIGLWHGAEFKFVAYGLYNGFIIIAGLLLEPYLKAAVEKLHINVDSFGWRLFTMVRTFAIVSLGRILPRASSFGAAVAMFASMCTIGAGASAREVVESFGLLPADYAVLAIGCVIWLVASIIQERVENREKEAGKQSSIVAGENVSQSATTETGAELRCLIDRLPLPVRWAVYLFGLAVVLVFGIYGTGYDAASFIYRAF